MAGERIKLRTIVQNLSDTTKRIVTMKLWIKHADGSVATTTSGQRLETTQAFTIPVWSEKSKFWPKGALGYEGSNMNSGLENCELIYQIPADAVLNNGDTVAFEVTDESGNVLASDNTETQTYANINIEYKFEDGSPIPNAKKAVIPIAVGSKLNRLVPSTLFGHTLVRAEGHDQTANWSGQTVTCYYSGQTGAHIHDWGAWVSNGNGTHTRTCKTDNSHKETANCIGGTATCENKAVCSVCGAEYGEKLGHDWGEVKYTWTSYNTCKAERVCKHDSAHIESETVTATGSVIRAATCKEKGKMKYTANFVNTAFAAQEKEADTDFAEHIYGVWQDEIPATTEDFGTKGHYECSVCGKFFDKDHKEITDLKIAKIATHNVVINGESKFYTDGESVTVTAEDKEGKVFKGWLDASGKTVSTEKSYNFKVTGKTTLTAVYEDVPSGGGETTPTPDKKDGLSGGSIAGIVIGSVLLAGIGGFAIFWFAVKKKTFAD